MNVRLIAALAGAAFFLSATAAVSAQTTMAPTPGPVVGPTAAPQPIPVGSAVPTASTNAPTARPPATMPMPGGPLALGARYLRGTRTISGYRLTGQAQVKDACTAARFAQFLGLIFPPQYNVVQYRRPGTLGLLCAQHLTWVTIAPLNVTSVSPPRYVSVRTQKGLVRVPILPGPVY
ncbi:MAG TPA: hypothetical protein VGC72_11365 [Candidatus Elarobacter sp.]|jgi:hypothetical protein